MAQNGNNGNGKVRLADIAKAARVSKAAAAFVLNGSCQTARVSEETAQRIREKATELNYVPNRMAQLLAGVSAKTIGILAPELMQQPGGNMADVVVEMNHELQRNGYQSLMGICTEWDALPRKFINEMVTYRLDGMVLAGLNSALDFHRVGAGIPETMPVVVAGDLQRVDRDQVVIDKAKGMANLTEHCIEEGHRRFVFVRSAGGGNMTKLAGIQKALKAAGIPFGSDRILEVSGNLGDGTEIIDRVLALDPVPTCVMCSCDLYAVKAIRGCMSRGLQVPRDISVTGCDDQEWITDLSDVALTTIRQPREEMGREVARLLLKRIEQPGLPIKKVTLLPTLVVRRSMGHVRTESFVK